MNLRLASCLAALAAALALPAQLTAASLLTLSNPVADGAISTAGGNNVRADWAPVTPFTSDPDESQPTDWQQVFFAHDTSSFYLRYLTFRTAAGGFLTWQQNAFLDTDQSWDTGYNGGWLAVGAEYMLQGQTVYRYTGGGGADWSWASIGSLAYDDWPLDDQELTLPRSLIGAPVGFDFLLLAGDDIYPDSANGGAAGGYFTYTTVPEPSCAALFALMALGLAAGRRR
jgi:hypothetical protein